jgi:hypothetical protein
MHLCRSRKWLWTDFIQKVLHNLVLSVSYPFSGYQICWNQPNFSIKLNYVVLHEGICRHWLLTRIASWRQTPPLVGKELMAINQDGVKHMNWVIVNHLNSYSIWKIWQKRRRRGGGCKNRGRGRRRFGWLHSIGVSSCTFLFNSLHYVYARMHVTTCFLTTGIFTFSFGVVLVHVWCLTKN